MKAQIYWDEDMVLQVYADDGEDVPYLQPLPIDIPDDLFRQYEATRAAFREVQRMISDTCGQSPPNEGEEAKARYEAERAEITARIERQDALDLEQYLAENPEQRALHELLNSPSPWDTCVLTGEEGENPDDCSTHNHRA